MNYNFTLMKTLIYTIVASSILLALSCETKSKQTTQASDSTQQNVVQTTTNEPVKKDLSDWESFWETFYTAVKNGDKKTVESMIHPEGFSPNFMEDTYEYIFEGEVLSSFLKLKSSDAKVSSIESFPEVEGVKILKEMSYDEGHLWLYFGHVNGAYKLIYIVAAG